MLRATRLDWCAGKGLCGFRSLHVLCQHEIEGGQIYTKGCGVFGALGHGDSLLDAKYFKKVPLPPTVTGVKSVSAGWGHSAAITTDNRLLVFGRPYDFSNLMQINKLKSVNQNLGRFVGRFTNWFGDSSSDEGLYTMPLLIPGMDNIKKVSCSAGLTVALTHAGELYSFGLNRWGQCGVNQKEVDGGTNAQGIHVFDPIRVELPAPVREVDTGLQHCVALLENGEVWVWGKGNRGQLGNGDVESSNTPTRVRLLKDSVDKKRNEEYKAVQVSAGFNHTVVLTEDGKVLIWGKGMSTELKADTGKHRGSDSKKERQARIRGGQQKVAVYEDQLVPRVVSLPDEARYAKEISCSNFTVVIRDDAGGLWAMGVGEYDRNTIIEPIVVQRAIQEILADEEVGSAAAVVGDHAAQVVRLAKGYQRVAVLDTTSAGTEGYHGLCEYSSSERAFEVVLHQGEAFLQVIEALESRNEPSNHRGVLDYATGWQHHIAVFSPDS